MVERRDVEFDVEGGDRLRGWLFVPENSSARHPAISMAHGYAGVKEHGLERFARAFAEAGFVVLVHDHRNFGSSDGAIRHDIDPRRQIADWRRGISFLESLPEVDADRIGVWGTSYAGGHVLVLAATEPPDPGRRPSPPFSSSRANRRSSDWPPSKCPPPIVTSLATQHASRTLFTREPLFAKDQLSHRSMPLVLYMRLLRQVLFLRFRVF